MAEIDNIRGKMTEDLETNKQMPEENEETASEAEPEEHPSHALELAFTALAFHVGLAHKLSSYTRTFYDYYVTKAICVSTYTYLYAIKDELK